jgi:hypothetical protein
VHVVVVAGGWGTCAAQGADARGVSINTCARQHKPRCGKVLIDSTCDVRRATCDVNATSDSVPELNQNVSSPIPDAIESGRP